MGDGLRIRGLHVSYGAVRALIDVEVDVAEGEIVAVVGRSGSGKSSLLRAVGGLVLPSAGTVQWAGSDVTRRKPHKRGFGRVVTAPSLFEKYSVSGNVSYGLGSWPREGRARRVSDMLARFDVSDIADAPIAELTDTQARRVSLARSLAPSPRVMLLDEPFGGMDGPERSDLAGVLTQSLRAENIATLYVTHAVDEAVATSDRIVVLDGGRVAQDGPAPLVRQRPASRSIAEHFGFGPFLAGVGESGRVTTELGDIAGQGILGAVAVGVGQSGLRPDPLGVEVPITHQRAMGGFVEVTVTLPRGATARLRSTHRRDGSTIAVALDGNDCVVLPADRR